MQGGESRLPGSLSPLPRLPASHTRNHAALQPWRQKGTMTMLETRALTPRSDDSELLLKLDGTLDAKGLPQLQQALDSAPPSIRTLILDMEGIPHIASAGLQVLLQAHKDLEARAGRLLVCCAQPDVRQALELSGVSEMLELFETREQALAASHVTLETFWHRDIDLGRLAFTPFRGGHSHLELWDEGAPAEMFQASLAELGICLGHGGFGSRRDQAMENRGLFFAGRAVAALLPDGAMDQPLFLTTRYPQETVIFVARGVSVEGPPVGCLDFETQDSTSLGALLEEVDRCLPAPGSAGRTQPGLPRVCLLLADSLIPSAQDGPHAAGAALISVHYRGPREPNLPPALASLPWRRDGDLNCCALALTLNRESRSDCDKTPHACLEAVAEVERIRSFMELGPEARFGSARAWIWTPRSMRSAREKLLELQLPEGVELSEAREAVVRRLFAGFTAAGSAVSRLQLIPLRPIERQADPGLFLVRRFAAKEAPLPPALLELDSARRIEARRQAFERLQRPLLPEQGLTLENSAAHEGQGGLCFGFADQKPPQLSISTLAQLYVSLSVTELLPLFERLFTRLLHPWYGQPLLETLQLFREHDPLQSFPDLLDAAQTGLGLSPDSEHFDSHELGRPVRNPFHALAHIFPARMEESRQWYASVIHGDLHLHNVLLDSQHGMFVAGCHATRRGNVVSDMARMEPVLLLEYSRLANESELDALARFLEAWYAAPSYAAVPPFGYAGSDPRISKAYQVLRLLRRYADTVTLFETDMQPYLLAVLQWTLPAVTFDHWEPERRRLAAIMGGILCERILGEPAS